MTNVAATILALSVVHLLAVSSPGPDFALVCRNSLAASRRAGVLSAVGIAAGNVVHLTYCLLGIALVIQRSPRMFNALKLAGAAYLVYLGVQSLRARPVVNDPASRAARLPPRPATASALREGFITNLLNPKATLYFLAVFTQFIRPSTSRALAVLYAVEMVSITLVWFVFVAGVVAHPVVRGRFERAVHWVERVMGVILIALAAGIAASVLRSS